MFLIHLSKCQNWKSKYTGFIKNLLAYFLSHTMYHISYYTNICSEFIHTKICVLDKEIFQEKEMPGMK